MEILSATDMDRRGSEIAERLRSGAVAVFPTDTLYGFTVDARHHSAVEKILELKQRRSPVSCIPHDLVWARSLVAENARSYFEQKIEEYRGGFTSLWPVSEGKRLLQPAVQTDALIAFRLPQHWISEFSVVHGIPLTTTSVNRTGEAPMRSLEDLDPELISGIDIVVDGGILLGSPSTLVRCDQTDFPRTERS